VKLNITSRAEGAILKGNLYLTFDGDFNEGMGLRVWGKSGNAVQMVQSNL
jgi:hypothetical protein